MAANRGTGKRDFDELERRRLQAAKLLKQGLRRWSNRIEAGSPRLELSKAGRAGRKPKLGPAELKRLKAILKGGPAKSGFATGAWSLGCVASVIRKEFEVKYHPRHVSWILRKKLGVSLSARSRG